MKEALEGKLLISILAGTTIPMMKEWVPETCTVVRSMPNTPSKVRLDSASSHRRGIKLTVLPHILLRRPQIREGMTVLSTLPPSDPQTPLYRDILMALFNPLGKCRFMDEKVCLLASLLPRPATDLLRPCLPVAPFSSPITLRTRRNSTSTPSPPSADQDLLSCASYWKLWPTEES